MVTNPLYYQRRVRWRPSTVLGAPSATSNRRLTSSPAGPVPRTRYGASDRHVGMELSLGKRDVERTLLSRDAVEARRHARLRRAAVLRRAFRYRRGQLDFLQAAARRSQSHMGRAHETGLRLLSEAVPEVHA